MDYIIPKRFAHFIAETTYEKLPQDVIQIAKERIMDTLGAALAGASHWEYKENFLQASRKFGKGDTAVITGGAKEFPLARAAMINATFAHGIELDDGHKNAGVHCGAAIIPTALTLGSALGCSGKEILTAIVIGYDIVYRLASNMAPYQIKKGFHPSGNDDTIGSMAVAGKLLNLTENQLEQGLGLSALYASGLMEATVTGQASKCIQVGNAVYNGIAAAYYAQENMEGSLSAFEGKSGFFKAKSENVDPEKVCEGLGEKFLIGDTYSKMYPTARHSQPAIEAVLDLVAEHGFSWEAVEKVWVGTHQVAYDMTGIIKAPKDAGEAKFSLAYGVALALHEHCFGIAHLDERYTQDPINIKLGNLVTVAVDPDVQKLYPKRRGAKVKVYLKDGTVYEKELYDLKGSPGNPIGWKELEQKFRINTESVLPKKEADTLLALIQSMDEASQINPLMDILNTAR